MTWAESVGHPSSECGDPVSCEEHGPLYLSYGSGRPSAWCPTCSAPSTVVEEFDETIGYEEHARDVRVTVLDCGHEIVTRLGRQR